MAIAVLLMHFALDYVRTATGAPVPERLTFTMGPVGLQMRLHAIGSATASGRTGGSVAVSLGE